MGPPDAAGADAAAPRAAERNDKKPVTLFAFDFDHTIVDDNTDTYVLRAAPHSSSPLPDALRRSYVRGEWTAYMGRVFEHLHGAGVTERSMRAALEQIPLTPGMPELLGALQRARRAGAADALIVSDRLLLLLLFCEHMLCVLWLPRWLLALSLFLSL
jgi:hypothetical protein